MPVKQALRYDSRQNARRGEPPECVLHYGGGWVFREVSYQLFPAAGDIECFHLFHQNEDLCWTDVTPFVSVNKLRLYLQLECHDKPIQIREMSFNVIDVHPCVCQHLSAWVCQVIHSVDFLDDIGMWRDALWQGSFGIWFFRPCKVPMELRGVWRWRRTAWRWDGWKSIAFAGQNSEVTSNPSFQIQDFDFLQHACNWSHWIAHYIINCETMCQVRSYDCSIPVFGDGFGMRPWSNVPMNWRPKSWIYSDASTWHKVRLGKELDMLVWDGWVVWWVSGMLVGK